MMSQKQLEQFRAMGPDGRLELVMQALSGAFEALLQGPPEIVQRRFDLIKLRNDEFNQRVRERLGAAEMPDAGP